MFTFVLQLLLLLFSLSLSLQEGFHDVMETLLRRQRRKLREEERARTQPDASESNEFWQNTAVVASVAVGAAVLFGLKQAFS